MDRPARARIVSAVEQGIASLEQAAQYSAAHDALITSAKTKLTEAELSDQAKVRAKAQTLNKLGEYKWRYRVVDEGGSPRDEAIAVLEEAATLIEGYLSAHCADDPDAARARAGLPSCRSACRGSQWRGSSSTRTAPKTRRSRLC